MNKTTFRATLVESSDSDFEDMVPVLCASKMMLVISFVAEIL